MPGVTPQERCVAVFKELIEGGFRYPGISRAHFYSLLTKGQDDPLLTAHVNRFIDELAMDLRDRGCALEMDELKLALIQIASAVFLNILAPDLFERRFKINLRKPDICLAYITRLVNRLLA
jgi:hypothetical protein